MAGNAAVPWSVQGNFLVQQARPGSQGLSLAPSAPSAPPQRHLAPDAAPLAGQVAWQCPFNLLVPAFGRAASAFLTVSDPLGGGGLLTPGQTGVSWHAPQEGSAASQATVSVPPGETTHSAGALFWEGHRRSEERTCWKVQTGAVCLQGACCPPGERPRWGAPQAVSFLEAQREGPQ